MTPEQFSSEIIRNLPFAPNDQQKLVVEALSRFCLHNAADDPVFLLNGYAGTGKTSICSALVNALSSVQLGSMLLAPTGRAAKVFGSYAHRPAYTIHRKIYRHALFSTGAGPYRSVTENKLKDTIFIVDEASMITGMEGNGGNLLEDLIHYVYTGDNCRLILLGDTAQLPPVGCDFSPAMSADVLRSYGLKVNKATLTETARQAAKSGILFNATWIRRAMRTNPIPLPRIHMDRFTDVKMITGEEMAEEVYNAYSRDGVQESLIITRSNQKAAAFNKEIRASVLYYEERLVPNELLIVAKNNYHWTSKIKEIDFIANGDSLIVQKVISTEDKYGLQFADVILSVPDTEIAFDAKIILNTLHCDTPALSNDRLTQLYQDIIADPDVFDENTPLDARIKALRTNPYWNALQVKYGYAVTCHKAQGGQWKNVFVDLSYIPPESMGLEFYRWLYTAVSRARQRLYILGLQL